MNLLYHVTRFLFINQKVNPVVERDPFDPTDSPTGKDSRLRGQV